jgi:hypothetical protein
VYSPASSPLPALVGSWVTAGLGSAQSGCGVGLSGDKGAGFGLAKGDGGSFSPSVCPFVLGWMCKTGERTSLTWGAVSPMIEAAAVLVDVRLGLANTKTARDDVSASCMRTSFVGVTGLSGEHDAGLGLSKGDRGLVGRKSLALGTGPIDSSMFVAQSNVMFAA